MDAPQAAMAQVSTENNGLDKEAKDPIRYKAALADFLADEELLLEVVDGFMESALERIASIRVALKNHDFEAIQMHGHTLKGGAGTVFADTMMAIAHAMERAAEKEDFKRCSKNLIQMQDELACLEHFITVKKKRADYH